MNSKLSEPAHKKLLSLHELRSTGLDTASQFFAYIILLSCYVRIKFLSSGFIHTRLWKVRK